MNDFKFSLAFRVFHPKASIADIDTAVGRKADYKQEVGKPRKTPKDEPLKGVYDQTYCCYELVEGRRNTFEKSLRKWTRTFGKRKAALKKLRRSGGRLEYYLVLLLEGNAGIVLEDLDLREMSVLGIQLALDIYP